LKADQFKEVLARYANGTASEEEKRRVDAWYDGMNEVPSDLIPDEQREADIKQEMRAVIMGYMDPPVPLKWSVRRYYKYAAILILGLSSLFFFRKQGEPKRELSAVVIQTHGGEYKKVTLSDRSVIHMNPGSVLRIPNGFGRSAVRMVLLEKGEAFFEVTKDAKHPFIVSSKELNTKVLGTKFAVNATISAPEVSVSEGRVEVSHREKVLGYLTPGRRLRYRPLKQSYIITDFATREHNIWFQKVIELNRVTFDELARIMKINYGVRLHSPDSKTLSYTYSLQIRSTRSLEETLKIICSIHQNKYRRANNEVTIY
jgi:transmembrane sensor